MRGLFFKIFIIFWIAQSLIFVISTGLILAHRFPRPNFLLDPAYSNLQAESAVVIKAFETKGCGGIEAFARERKETIALADENGTALCGSTALVAAGKAQAAEGITAKPFGENTL